MNEYINDDCTITTCENDKLLYMIFEYVEGLKQPYQVQESDNVIRCYQPKLDVVCIATPFLVSV